MKKEYSVMPPGMEKTEQYGFSWMDFVTAVPSPLFVVTTWKDNGKPNACLQSWATFTGNTKGFFAVLSAVNQKGHLYKTLKETGVCVLNFPPADLYDRCAATIRNNQWDVDELAASGLTVEPAKQVNAPRIAECFLSLECEYAWEKALAEGTDHMLICLQVVNIGIEEAHQDETALGRYGETGLVYNVHYPVNPETYDGKARDYIAILQKLRETAEY